MGAETRPWEGEEDARQFLGLLFDEAGRVVELRAPKPKTKRFAAAGYFDDQEKLIAAVAAADGRAEGLYVTLNPVNPALLARAANVLKCPIETTTADADILSRRWLLVDLDPVRPKGVSSSEAEHTAALARAEEVRVALAADGWPEPLQADSGNGAHLLYRIELPREDGGLVRRVLEALAFRFGDQAVGVDRSVFNPARISKLYGTLAAKGDSTPDRPHRRSRLLTVPAALHPVPTGLLEAAAAKVPKPRPAPRSGNLEPIDVDRWIAEHGLEVARSSDWNGGRRWILRVCPFDPAHTDRSAYIVQFASGAVAAGCLHASCAGKKWKDLRALLEPERAGRPPSGARAEEGDGGEGEAPLAYFLASDELRDLVPAVWAPIIRANTPLRLFTRAGHLVELKLPEGAAPHLEPLNVDDAHGLVFRAGFWRRRTEEGALRPAHPPKDVARDLLSRPHPDLPRIEAVVAAPVFDADWRLVAEAGFHAPSGLYLHLDGLEVVTIPERPTKEEVLAARAVLEEIVAEFPFVKPSDRAHAIAAFILPFVRRAIRGPTPVHDIEAPVPGTGKGLLADVISRVATGKAVPASTMPRDEDELRKKITAQLLAARPIVCFDNVTTLAFGTFAAAVTADPWCDRLLGKSHELVLENRVLWLVTANNPKLTTEIARRCIRIRIDPRMERPWERSGFRHPDLRRHVSEKRSAVVQAILTLVQGWLADGAPRGRRRLGSFEVWSEVLGGILEFAGVPGFLDDLNDLYARADDDGAEWRAFVLAWQAKLPPGPQTSGELAAFCDREHLLDGLLSTVRTDTARARATRLGKALSAREGRVFAGSTLVRNFDGHGCQAVWLLDREAEKTAEPAAESEADHAGHAGHMQDMRPQCHAEEGRAGSGNPDDCRTCRTFLPSLNVCAGAHAHARACESEGAKEVLQVLQSTGNPHGTGESAAEHGENTSGTTSGMSGEPALFGGVL